MTPAAHICLYGAAGPGFAFLTSRPPASTIATTGGWNREQTRPSGQLRSLTETIEAAKESLRALGIDGEAIVFFPGGEHCARTPIGKVQPVSGMHIEPAPLTVVTAKTIERAAHEIAKAKAAAREQAEEWFENFATWHRPAPPGTERPYVGIFRGDLVWVSTGRGAQGRWGIAQAFSPSARQIQVDGEWIDAARVLMRQEAIAQGIRAPQRTDAPGRSPFALLIDALRSRAALGKLLELQAADGTHRMRIAAVSNDRGPRAISLVAVSGTIDGRAAQLVIPADYDLAGAPVRSAELRWSATRRVEVDPRTIQFVPSGDGETRARRTKSAGARRDSRARSAPDPVSVDERSEHWDRHGLVWHRPSATGVARRVELRHGDLAWVSFGGSSVRARGTWGRVQGFSAARRKVKVGQQWHKLPLVFPYEEAIAQGVPAPAAVQQGAKVEGPAHAPFLELIRRLRSPGARGRTLELVSTDGTPHTMRIKRVEQDVPAVHVSGSIKRSDARLTIWTDTDTQGAPKSYAQLRKGSRAYRVDPRRIHFAGKDERPATPTGGP